MVRVPGDDGSCPRIPGLDQAPGVQLDDYLIDRHEVTNEEYKKFVDAGGYAEPGILEAALRQGRADDPVGGGGRRSSATRRAAPAPRRGRSGTFPKGLEKHPVAGVSWYEAAAYAEFAGKSLPTVYHWNLAAQPWYADPDPSREQLPGDGTRPGRRARVP